MGSADSINEASGETLGQGAFKESAPNESRRERNVFIKGDVNSGGPVVIGDKNTVSVNFPAAKPVMTGVRNNVPECDRTTFVGRDEALKQLHTQLAEQETIAITAISGMGGIGKTELAKQYAQAYAAHYPGGVCWVQVRDAEVAPQIVEFAVGYLGIVPPEGLSLAAQVQYCWNHWPLAAAEGEANEGADDKAKNGPVLVVYDDVPDYAKVEGLLPPQNLPPQNTDANGTFRVLMTTRQQQLAVGLEPFLIKVLSEAASLTLLQNIVGEQRTAAELETAKAVCEWVGYLPLGLELVGRYLARKPEVSYAKLLNRLEAQRVGARALQKAYPGMTAKLGVVEAFELSWQTLDKKVQQTACWLSLFALAQIPWELAAAIVETEEEQEEIEEERDELIACSLLQRAAPGVFQLHQLVREYLLAKLHQREDADAFKKRYCRLMIALSRRMPSAPTRELISRVTPVMPHIAEAAMQWQDWLIDEENELIWPFFAMARFYNGQGAYAEAEPWYKNCLTATQKRFGDDHPGVATSLNNLALLYESQGRYEQAEPLYTQALDLSRKLLGDDHPEVATILNNLAGLYERQDRYEQAELLYIQALDLSRKLLGDDHPDVATSLNNLAFLYERQGRYEQAEPLYIQALDLSRKLLGDDHPQVASSLNNLAFLYARQGRYEKAEPLYAIALVLRRKLLGDDHPQVASSLNNLAGLYESQRRYEKAELLYLQAISIAKKCLGKDHPNTQTFISNLIGLISTVVKANQQEQLSDNPLTQYIRDVLNNT